LTSTVYLVSGVTGILVVISAVYVFMTARERHSYLAYGLLLTLVGNLFMMKFSLVMLGFLFAYSDFIELSIPVTYTAVFMVIFLYVGGIIGISRSNIRPMERGSADES